jgi:hypothetical protein
VPIFEAALARMGKKRAANSGSSRLAKNSWNCRFSLPGGRDFSFVRIPKTLILLSNNFCIPNAIGYFSGSKDFFSAYWYKTYKNTLRLLVKGGKFFL